jgi:signal peptidase I
MGTSVAKPRRWLVAALLALFGFGSGYLYVGRPMRALFAVGTALLFSVVMWPSILGWLIHPARILIPVALALILIIGFPIDAARIAASTGSYTLRWYNRWWLYLGLTIVGVTIAELQNDPAAGIRRFARSFSFPSVSMEPTLRVGDHVLADMRAFDVQEPARGDIVVFTLPRDPSATYAKRVVGLPGEKVQVRNGVLHIDGQAVPTVDAGTYDIVSPGQPEKSSQARLKRETLPNGVSFLTLDAIDNGFYDNTPRLPSAAGPIRRVGRQPRQIGRQPRPQPVRLYPAHKRDRQDRLGYSGRATYLELAPSQNSARIFWQSRARAWATPKLPSPTVRKTNTAAPPAP